MKTQDTFIVSKYVRVAAGVALTVGAILIGGVLLTSSLGNRTSTTALTSTSTVTVNGHPALAPKIVAGRTQSRYHPLPWLGKKITGTRCPSGLEAVVGAKVTCTARSGSATVTIPVTVKKASGRSVTWKFDR